MLNDVPSLDSLVKVAKRENNTKRSYLYVNPLQGKHVPVSPTASYEVFGLLADKIKELYYNERIMVIGFAETATAIGTAIAYKNDNVKCYLSTTREEVPGAEYLYFTESHSHATEQRLVINDFDKYLDNIDRIIFAEDEVTTGNTIEKLINCLKERFPKVAIKFSIASIVNSMTDYRLEEVKNKAIDCIFVRRIPFQYRISDVNYYKYQEPNHNIARSSNIVIKQYGIGAYWNQRIVTRTELIRNRVNSFADNVISKIENLNNAEILILGTEEFMFPGMLLGKKIEDTCMNAIVRFHATSRSPIEVSIDKHYPLNHRYALESFYESDRKIFVYNLKKYDIIIIVSDADKLNKSGVISLVGALEALGNNDINLFIWRDI